MHPFKLLFLRHFHVLLLSLSYICLTCCPYIAFPLQLFSLFSLSCCLNSFGCVEFSLGTVFNVIFDIPSKAAFLSFHSYLAYYHSSSSFHPRETQTVDITSRVYFLIHCHTFPSLSVYLMKFEAFCPFNNTCTITHQRNSPIIYCYDLFSTTESTFHDSFRSPQIFSPKVIFHFAFLDFVLF